MRRSKQALSAEVCREVLERGTGGVLALWDEQAGEPYQVPLSYALVEDGLVFHGANEGRKLEVMKACASASFCVVDRDEVVPEEFLTRYRSVVCTGRMRVIEDADERRRALLALGERFWPGHEAEAQREIASCEERTCVFVMRIESMTGKEALSLAKERAALRQSLT